MVHTGLDRILTRLDILGKKRVGLIANHTSVNCCLAYSWDILPREGLDLDTLFTPEHGLFGTEQDQVPAEASGGYPFKVVTLYGSNADSLAPLESHVSGLDTVLFDLQDVGARYYTYVNTMILFLKAVHGMDIEFMVLDRPNPLGGRSVEGPVLKKGFESFVGLLPVPVRHGLTAGELARLAVDYLKLDVNLRVIEMSGWDRSMYFEDTGLLWVPPSPNMPTTATALVYPGMCLFEGTNASEGRGTTTPFEVIGAPGIDPRDLAAQLNGMALPGVYFRPLYVKPTFNKYHGRTIGGVYIHVTDRDLFRPFLSGVALVIAVRSMMPGFEFTSGVYEFNNSHPAFDLLTGSSVIREMIESGKSLEEIAAWWEKEDKVFSGITEEHHLYRE